MNKIIGGIVVLVGIYVLFFYNDGALFEEISGRLGAWFVDRVNKATQQ